VALADSLSGARLLRMALLSLLGFLAIFVEAAPLGVGPKAIPSPDLLFCIVAAIAVRRPGSAPLLLVFVLGLSRDLLTDLPVGLGALTLVLAAEGLKARSVTLRRRSVVIEWLAFAGIVLAMLAAQWAMVFVSFAQPPYLFDLLRQWVLTVLAYPLVVVTVRWIFRIGWKPQAKVARAAR
jgi:rod shape-determining protein MreD